MYNLKQTRRNLLNTNNEEQTSDFYNNKETLYSNYINSSNYYVPVNSSWNFTQHPLKDSYIQQRLEKIKSDEERHSMLYKPKKLVINNSKKYNIPTILSYFPSFLDKYNNYNMIKGDIHLPKSPKYSFGRQSYEDNKKNILKSEIKSEINIPSKHYNIKPLVGLNNPSPKYTMGKRYYSNVLLKHIDPGPGAYIKEHDALCKNGRYQTLLNPSISCFGSYTSERFNESKTNVNDIPAPNAYNLQHYSMFNGTGKILTGNFNSNLAKSMGKRFNNVINFKKIITPGPGHYNHYTIFGGKDY
jgi:hypothetical protein